MVLGPRQGVGRAARGVWPVLQGRVMCWKTLGTLESGRPAFGS